MASADHNDYNGDRLRNTAIIFIVLELICVGLRVWARRFKHNPIGWDDSLVFLSLPFCVGLCVIELRKQTRSRETYRGLTLMFSRFEVAIRNGGVGYHIDVVSPSERLYWAKSSLIAAPVVYSVAVAFPKLAILAIYLKVFVDKFSRLCCYGTAAIIVLTAVVNIPTTIWQCSPVEYLWDKSDPKGWCFDLVLHFRYGSLPNIVTDVIMLILPMPVIWKLHTSRRVKIGLAATFLTGSV